VVGQEQSRRPNEVGPTLRRPGAALLGLGTSSTNDVTFVGAASDQCVISTVNPQQGPDGNTSGFDSIFGSGWSLLGKVTSGNGSNTLDGVDFTWTFAQLTATTGTWSLVTDVNTTFDLVFAMHAANRSGAFLFEDESRSPTRSAQARGSSTGSTTAATFPTSPT